MTDNRVRATAIVDNLSSGLFKVTVTGLPPHAQQRVYTLSARDDNSAAMTGIEYFVNAMSAPPGEPHED